MNNYYDNNKNNENKNYNESEKLINDYKLKIND